MPHVITLTGPSGSGKSTAVGCLLDCNGGGFKPILIPKYTTRAPRADDRGGVVCVPEIPDTCDLVYEQYQVRYGLESAQVFRFLADGFTPVIILNDIRVVEDIKAALGGLVRSIFVFREAPVLETQRRLAESRGSLDEEDLQRRHRKAHAIYRIYIENLHLFDHVIINSGPIEVITLQARRIVEGLSQRKCWPLRQPSEVK